jgi:hypothetical protein
MNIATYYVVSTKKQVILKNKAVLSIFAIPKVALPANERYYVVPAKQSIFPDYLNNHSFMKTVIYL